MSFNKIFDFSSDEQIELLKYVNRLMDHDDENIIMEFGVDFDRCVMYLANAWTRYANGTQEERSEIHSLQHKLVITTVGAMANYLTSEEWDEWIDFINAELAKLRSFNGSFLGLLWHRKKISDNLADILNVFAWYVSIYYIIGNNAYQRIRPRIIQDKSSEDYVISNQIMTILQTNMNFYIRRFSLNESHFEFVKNAFILLENQPKESMSNWESYYENSDHELIDNIINSSTFMVQ